MGTNSGLHGPAGPAPGCSPNSRLLLSRSQRSRSMAAISAFVSSSASGRVAPQNSHWRLRRLKIVLWHEGQQNFTLADSFALISNLKLRLRSFKSSSPSAKPRGHAGDDLVMEVVEVAETAVSQEKVHALMGLISRRRDLLWKCSESNWPACACHPPSPGPTSAALPGRRADLQAMVSRRRRRACCVGCR